MDDYIEKNIPVNHQNGTNVRSLSYTTDVQVETGDGYNFHYGGSVTVRNDYGHTFWNYTFDPNWVVAKTMKCFRDAIKQEMATANIQNDQALCDTVYQAYWEYMRKLFSRELS
ncbi:MAG: hypothetical protein IJJ20_08165 [Thermoguttaceae bacterium]|nr:hypothetical protein [Thermoguttaceae bacterium]